MASKKIRVVKSEWPGFVKEFCNQNQFRPIAVAQGDEKIAKGAIFVGVIYDSDKSRVEVLAVGDDPARPVVSVCAVEGARGMYIMRTEDVGGDIEGLQLQGKPGVSNITVLFEGGPVAEAKHAWISSVAKRCYEARGCEPGQDMDDWLSAEKAVETCICSLCD